MIDLQLNKQAFIQHPVSVHCHYPEAWTYTIGQESVCSIRLCGSF